MMKLVPIRDAATADIVKKVAADDGHELIFPTHVVIVNDGIAGAFTTCLPAALSWFHTQRCKPVESMRAIQLIEAVGACSLNLPGTIVPVTKSSPFFKQMTRLGYRDLGEVNLFYKEF